MTFNMLRRHRSMLAETGQVVAEVVNVVPAGPRRASPLSGGHRCRGRSRCCLMMRGAAVAR
jgi:hypothetical protein